MHDDVLIVGGGIIGLSLAYELSSRGMLVRLIDRAEPGREASWAGAGILPPVKPHEDQPAYLQLAGLSCALLPQWSERLRDETGIDNGYHRTGGIYLARDQQAAEILEQKALWWSATGVAAERLAGDEVGELEPALASGPETPFSAAYYLPEEAQLRNPRHLNALVAACLRHGTRIEAGRSAEGFRIAGRRVETVLTNAGDLHADNFCITGGAWSRALLAQLGVVVPLVPVRGQIVLLRGRERRLRHVVNESSRYLVPRLDGRLLIGSTEEDAGFDKSNTAEGVAGLLRFALALAPSLRSLSIERCWAGLRPGTPDQLPYLGRIAELTNAFVAAGHFRSGLSLSAATAVVLGQIIRGEEPQIDLRQLRLGRATDATPSRSDSPAGS